MVVKACMSIFRGVTKVKNYEKCDIAFTAARVCGFWCGRSGELKQNCFVEKKKWHLFGQHWFIWIKTSRLLSDLSGISSASSKSPLSSVNSLSGMLASGRAISSDSMLLKNSVHFFALMSCLLLFFLAESAIKYIRTLLRIHILQLFLN